MKEIFSVRYTLVSLALVAVWWMIAFKQPIAHEGSPPPIKSISLRSQSPTDYPLSPIDRDALHRALCGDTLLMTELIASWELDAKILERAGIAGIKHLSEEERFRSSLIARLLLSKEAVEHEAKARLSFIIDDAGNPIDLALAADRILPQTFFSAGVLLALVNAETITALPYGIRSQKQLYPEELTAPVAADIDTTTREELVMMRPDIAIVAQHYSNPATVETLRQMGITLYLHRNISTIEDIHAATQAFGHLSARPLKAELMVLFMKAALNAIDNSFLANPPPDTSDLLIVGYHTRFSLPGKKMLTYEFQGRLGILPPNASLENSDWEVPISEEQILAAKPKKLVIIAPDIPHIKEQLLARPALQHLLHQNGCSIFFLDEEVQKTASQYHVLAYYDLINAII